MKPRKVNRIVEEVTKNIIKRSKINRSKYLQKLNAAKDLNIRRDLLSCGNIAHSIACLLYTSPSPRDRTRSRMPSSA